tara:strand:- start:298 stop:474 length:177 start_codon:yes stop_codon:yes gene_type:complete
MLSPVALPAPAAPVLMEAMVADVSVVSVASTYVYDTKEAVCRSIVLVVVIVDDSTCNV